MSDEQSYQSKTYDEIIGGLTPQERAAYFDSPTRNTLTTEVRQRVEAAFRTAYGDGDAVAEPESARLTMRNAIFEANLEKDMERMGLDKGDPNHVLEAFRRAGYQHALDLAAQIEKVKAHPAYLDRKHHQHQIAVDHAADLYQQLEEMRARYLGER